MSIEDLCKDTVQVVTYTVAKGRSFARKYTPNAGASLSCNVQAADAREISAYSSRGQSISHLVYFPADPGLPESPNDVALLFEGRYLAVRFCYPEGRPGEHQLWVAGCEFDSARQDGGA